jgi:threonine/homoserine/homoserine lactone efflux protein
MLAALGTVIVTSLSGVMMPGPMFAVTIAKSMKSPWAGVLVSLGHAVIEVPLIMLVYFGLASFFQNEILKLVLSVLGGGMIVWMGYDMFRARKKLAKEGKDTKYNAFVAGIAMSGLNAFFIVWWLTVGSLLLMQFVNTVGPWGIPLFILVHWLCDLVWLAFVSFTIFKTHRFWAQKYQEWIFIVLSVALFYFGGQFVVKGTATYVEAGLTTTIIIILFAFVWLLIETEYLRIKLITN